MTQDEHVEARRSHLASIARCATDALHANGLAQKNWIFEWDNAVRRFGHCRYMSRRITLSKPLCAINTFTKAKDTILHEIAHALVGRGIGHGPRWVTQAQALGCTGDRCYDSTVTEPPRKFVGTCPDCGMYMMRHRRKARLACLSCCREHNNGQWDAQFMLTWRRC